MSPPAPADCTIRLERIDDHLEIDALYEAAFESRVEADLVALLRRDCEDAIALVALRGEELVGHILFTPMTITEGSERTPVLAEGLGLGPMGVLPEYQNQGIGIALAKAGLERCQSGGAGFVAVLGHPEYYPRFGFVPASDHGIRCPWEGVPDEAFMIQVLDPSTMPDAGGVAHYREEFDSAL